jgi:hypothetical protein
MHQILSVTPVMANAGSGAYSSGDLVGAPIETGEMMLNDGGQALLTSLTVLDKAAQGAALDIWFFREEPTMANADNAAFDLTDANLEKAIGHVKVVAGDYSAGSSGSMACVRNINLLLQSVAKKRSVWVAVASRGTPTYASLDLILKFGVEQL